MKTSNKVLPVLPQIAAIIVVMMSLVVGSMNRVEASARPASMAVSAAVFQEDRGPVHRPLATVGVKLEQTARINVVKLSGSNSKASNR